MSILPLPLIFFDTGAAQARAQTKSTILKYLLPSGSSAGAGGHGQKLSFSDTKRNCVKRDRLVFTPQGYVRRKVDVCT